MSGNAFFQGNRSPVMTIGSIPGKAVIDFSLVQQFKDNATNPKTSVRCYPNGNNQLVHDVMPSFAVFGQKGVRSVDAADGDTEATEVGFVAVAGLCWDHYCSQRQMESAHYCMGIATTESRLGPANDGVTGDPDHGFATLRCGTATVPNNGPHTLFPGSYYAWRFPPAPFHPDSDGGRKFNRGETINQLARAGEPTTQFRPQYVAFDPTDFSVQLACVFACIVLRGSENNDGIADKKFVEALPHLMGDTGCRPWSCLQDEAISYKFGLWGVALTMIETLVRAGHLTVNPGQGLGQQNVARAHQEVAELSSRIGLWDTNADNQRAGPLYEGLADVLLTNLSPMEPARGRAVDNLTRGAGVQSLVDAARIVPQTDAEHYVALRLHVSEVLLQGITSSWFSKTSQIEGRVTNTSAPADQLDVIRGYQRI